MILERPRRETCQLDLVTGRLNPVEPGKRVRFVFLPTKRRGGAVQDD